MYYTYFLRSVPFPEKTYIGFSTDLRKRFEAHNAGKSTHSKVSSMEIRNIYCF